MSDLASPLASSLGGDPLTKNLADLISIIRFRGDYRNVLRFPDANLTTEIQAAFAEWYELVVDTNEGYFDTNDTVTTTSSVGFVALPDGTWRVRGIDRLDGSDYIGLEQVGIAERNWFSSTPGRPCAYRLTFRGADLFPTPDAAYTLRVTYTPVAPTLDSTQRAFFNSWEEYTVYGALVRLALNEERDPGAWQQQLDIQRARITRGASQRKAQEPEYLVLRDSGYDDFDRDERWR